MWVQVNNQGSSQNLRSCSIWRKKKNTGLSFLKTRVRSVIHLFNILSSNCVSDRDITLPTKVRTVKGMVFPVVMYECDRWIIKKAECWRIDAFELLCWKRLMRVPWTVTDQTSQSILGVLWNDWCWSWNSNILATWCEELSHLKRLWCWERLEAGGEGDNRGWDGWMASPTQWTWVWVNSWSWWWTGSLVCYCSWGHKQLDTTEWLNWINIIGATE